MKLKLPDVRDVARQRAQERSGKTGTQPPSQSQAEETSAQMKAYQEVKEVSDQLSGAGQLRNQLDEKEKDLRKAQDDLAQQRMAHLEERIEQLTKAVLESKKPDEQQTKLVQQLEQARLELQREKWASIERRLDQLAQAKAAGATPASIADQLKDIREAAKEMGLTQATGTGIPADIQIQLKQMEIDTKIRLEQMADDRQERKERWDLEKKKWETDTALRQAEIQGNIQVQMDKNKTFGGALDRLGRVMAGAFEEEESAAGGAGVGTAPQVIEAGVGEYGEIECVKCKGEVPVAKDATKAICSSCGQIYSVKRIPVEE